MKDGYALVAVYSDAETQPEMQKHLYLFTIVNNQPLVLVTMQKSREIPLWLSIFWEQQIMQS